MWQWAFIFLLVILASKIAATANPTSSGPQQSIADHQMSLPNVEALTRVLLMRDHNTRVVVIGVSVLGLGAGIIGTFMLLRRQALLSDSISHAMLQGICLAFITMVSVGGTGKNLFGLLSGAAIFGMIAMAVIMLIQRFTRLKDDVAMAVVLSVFFGIGVALLGHSQGMEQGNAAGLGRFIYGKAASMLQREAAVILIGAVAVVIVCALLFKEFAMVSFDQDYAAVGGWPVSLIDGLMMILVVAVTVIGLQSVGLVLVVAMLIIPPAAARFWTDRLLPMTIVSAIFGATSGYFGATLSGLLPRLPTGPIIVMVAAATFAFSLVVGTRRGVAVRVWTAWILVRRIAMQHLLRAAYEHVESRGDYGAEFGVDELVAKRSWSRYGLSKLLRRAARQGWLVSGYRFSESGLVEATQMARNHRLWELYLIRYADIAPSHVDRDADTIEHVLGKQMVVELERALADTAVVEPVPRSPHLIRPHLG